VSCRRRLRSVGQWVRQVTRKRLQNLSGARGESENATQFEVQQSAPQMIRRLTREGTKENGTSIRRQHRQTIRRTCRIGCHDLFWAFFAIGFSDLGGGQGSFYLQDDGPVWPQVDRHAARICSRCGAVQGSCRGRVVVAIEGSHRWSESEARAASIFTSRHTPGRKSKISIAV
jgi:hypothetical protein